MKMIIIKGISGSGKTTTAEKVIAELKNRGYSVGSVKDIHFEDFKMDREGTNTYRHKLAGSQIVTARGKYETDIMFGERLDINKILDFYDCDYVIMEGDSGADAPIILTATHEKEIDERLNDRVIAVSGVISNSITEYKGLPVINALTDITVLTDYIERNVPERMIDLPACIDFTINGAEPELSPGLKEMLKKTMTVMAKELNIDMKNVDIAITIKHSE